MAKKAYIGVDGVARKVKQTYIGVDGVSRKCKSGYVGVDGVARQFLQGVILASDLALGSSVYLIENGNKVEYMVVHKGLPSTMYDSSCNGLWLLRKYAHSNIAFDTGNSNKYANSSVNTYLNGTFFNSFGSIERSTIKQVKIPYSVGGGGNTLKSGSNGLSTRAFLLAGIELGLTYSAYDVSADGAKLDYFESGYSTTAKNKRITTLNGGICNRWTRTPYESYANKTIVDSWSGERLSGDCNQTNIAIRPAVILPSNAIFDPDTMILKGVA